MKRESHINTMQDLVKDFDELMRKVQYTIIEQDRVNHKQCRLAVDSFRRLSSFRDIFYFDLQKSEMGSVIMRVLK